MLASLGIPNRLLSVSWLDLAESPSDSLLFLTVSFFISRQNGFVYYIKRSRSSSSSSKLWRVAHYPQIRIKSFPISRFPPMSTHVRKNCDHETENENFSKSKPQPTSIAPSDKALMQALPWLQRLWTERQDDCLNPSRSRDVFAPHSLSRIASVRLTSSWAPRYVLQSRRLTLASSIVQVLHRH